MYKTETCSETNLKILQKEAKIKSNSPSIFHKSKMFITTFSLTFSSQLPVHLPGDLSGDLFLQIACVPAPTEGNRGSFKTPSYLIGIFCSE